MSGMTLGAKFNLTLVGVFALGFVAVAYVVRGQLDEHARSVSLEKAGLMMESALSSRKYTTDQVRPLLIKDLDTVFHPQTVPAYSAVEMFDALRGTNPDYTYKEATLNPSNPRDRATDWEADIVEDFRNHPEAKERVGERMGATGPSLFIARPIKVSKPDCLQCHGEPSSLPKSVRAKYGDTQGLGWKLDEVVGAQIASVPTRVADDRAAQQFATFLGLLLAVFGTVLVVLNVLLSRMVISPIKRMAKAADKVSTGDMHDAEITVSGNDEIATLGASFNRMMRSLKKAMDLIDPEDK